MCEHPPDRIDSRTAQLQTTRTSAGRIIGRRTPASSRQSPRPSPMPLYRCVDHAARPHAPGGPTRTPAIRPHMSIATPSPTNIGRRHTDSLRPHSHSVAYGCVAILRNSPASAASSGSPPSNANARDVIFRVRRKLASRNFPDAEPPPSHLPQGSIRTALGMPRRPPAWIHQPIASNISCGRWQLQGTRQLRRQFGGHLDTASSVHILRSTAARNPVGGGFDPCSRAAAHQPARLGAIVPHRSDQSVTVRNGPIASDASALQDSRPELRDRGPRSQRLQCLT